MFKNLLICLFIILIACGAISQNDTSVKLQAGNYLIIGAYAKNKKQFADLYAQTITIKGYEAKVDFFPKKKLYFVYLKYYEDFNESIRGLYKHRKIDEFSDCWVYVMHQSEVIDKARNKQVSALSDMFASRFATTEETTNDSTIAVINQADVDDFKQIKDSTEIIAESDKHNADLDKNLTLPKKTSLIPLYLSLFDGQTAIEVKGEVEIIDAVNHEKINLIKGNEVVEFKDPENGTGELIFISNVFGFKRLQLDFNYHEPLDNEDMDYVTNIGDTIVVNFELLRYNKGDFMVMHNIFFFIDAAIMKPESKYELNQLTALMKERPSLKIRIHGHTNGNAAGVIKHFDPVQKNYFSLSEITKETTGSSKKLSEYRAEIIRHYLIDNGIDENRMDTKARGGKNMIYDKHDTQAKRNVRVEIEFLTD